MQRYSFLLLFLVLIACQNQSPYKISSVEQTWIKEEGCEIEHRYPQIRGVQDSMKSQALNEYLKGAMLLQREVAACLESDESRIIDADFQTFSNTDSLISLELILNKDLGDLKIKSYYPICMYMPEGYNPTLEMVMDSGIFDKILPKLEAWQAENPDKAFNKLAYRPGANYFIPFGLSKDSLILYPGAEGEMVAFNRLALSRDEIGY